MDAVIDNLGEILRAFGLVLGLLVVSGLASLVIGVVLAAMRVGPVKVLSWAAAGYVTLFRNTPLLMVFMFVVVAMPRLELNVPSFFAKGCVALSLYTAAFVCEAFRSGINAVPVGQAEAARAIGMPFGSVMRLVVLPQALRATVPPLTSVMIALAKNTSVAAVFGLAEATATMRNLLRERPDELWMIFAATALGYVLIVEALSVISNLYERRWKVSR